MEQEHTYAAFAGARLLASGPIEAVLLKTHKRLRRDEAQAVLLFDNRTGKQFDFDFRGSAEEVLARIPSHPLFAPFLAPVSAPGAPRTGPGRPRLGVISREVSLLPRHWEWLERQPQGISAALRTLVEKARLHEPARERARRAREAAGNFLWAMAGNLPEFEEASRALYAGDREGLAQRTRAWPRDIRTHVDTLLEGGHPAPETAANR